MQPEPSLLDASAAPGNVGGDASAAPGDVGGDASAAPGDSGPAGADAGQPSSDEVVTCAGQVCEVPDIARLTGLDVRACCYLELTCGVRSVGNPAVPDVCYPYTADSEPTTGCPSVYDEGLFVYKYGCCLADGVCGQLWHGAQQFGCSDPRPMNMPSGPACQPGASCTMLEESCGSVSECCAFENVEIVCAQFEDEPSTCTPACETDEDCPYLCCREAAGGGRACAPAELCSP